jgi:ligand-binding sensor domain-containing protein
MTILPAIKAKAENPEWIYHQFDYNAMSFMDDGEYMWIGVSERGVYKFRKETLTIVDTIANTYNAYALDITKDKDGIIWIATTKGLVKYDGINETRFTAENSGLPDNNVFAVSIDKNNIKWLGTVGGLAKFDDVNWTVFNTSNSGLPDNFIYSLALDVNDNIWIGTDSKGLAKFDGTNWTVYNDTNSGLSSNQIYKLIFDKTGNLWCGTIEGGLAKFDGNNWEVFNKTNSMLPENNVSNLALDSSNNLWLSNYAYQYFYGLVKFDGVDNWTIYNTSNSGINSDEIYALAIDKAGNKWVGVASDDIFKDGICIFKEGGVILSAVEYNNNIDSKIAFVYPNPVYDKFGIMNYEFNQYSISDLEGRVLLIGCIYNNEIYVGNLQTGIYVICLNEGINKKYLKFIKK